MKPEELRSNLELWNQKTKLHRDSAFYDVKGFRAGKTALNPLEITELGPVADKKLIHLQCHFGLDTLSWARFGAEVTGVDFSDEAIATAKTLSHELKLPANFVQSNIFDLPRLMDSGSIKRGSYDIVFTSYGVLGWLDDLKTWGRIVRDLLAPGGSFYIVEFHPALWVYDDDFQNIIYPYETREALKLEVTGSYTDRNAPIRATEYCWNHSLGSIVSALTEAGLHLEFLHEHYSIPVNIFPRPVEVHSPFHGYQIQGLENKVPMLYSIKASKL